MVGLFCKHHVVKFNKSGERLGAWVKNYIYITD